MPISTVAHAVVLLLRTQVAPGGVLGVDAAEMGSKRAKLTSAGTASEDHTNHIPVFGRLFNGSLVLRGPMPLHRERTTGPAEWKAGS